MQTTDLFEILSQKVKHKVDIYLAQPKIDRYFKDQGFMTNEVENARQEGSELGVSIFKVISGKLTGGTELTEKLVLDSRDKGKILETISGLTPDVITGNISPQNTDLFHYKGPAHFTYWGEVPDIYSPEENALIQKERERQEKILEKNTALFTFQINDMIYIAIANKEHFDLGMLASYGPLEAHGILGLPERKLSDNILLINPFWIWYEY